MAPARPCAVVCSPRFGGGDRHKRPPASRLARRDGTRRVAERARGRSSLALAACGGDERAPGRQRARRATSRSPSTRPSSRPSSGSPRPATCGSRSRTPATSSPEPRGDDLHRRREGRRLVLASAPTSPASPTPTARSGSSRTATRSWSSTARRHSELDAAPSAGAAAAQTDTFAFGPLDAGRQQRTSSGGVTPVSRRHLHGPLRARRRPQRQGEGGHRRRQPGRGRVRGHDHRQAAAGDASTTTATS